MRILGIESSAKAASVAIWQDGRRLAESFSNCGLTHSVTLMPMLEAMLRATELQLSELDAVAVAAGPGSFTGLRIGVANAKGLVFATGLRGIGVSTLEAMARTLPPTERLIAACMDARRSQLYNALFENRGGELRRLCPDRAISAEELGRELDSRGKHVIFVGDGAELCYNQLKLPGSELAPESLRYQSAWGVCLAAAAAPDTEYGEIIPNYIRPSQAERELSDRKSNKEK